MRKMFSGFSAALILALASTSFAGTAFYERAPALVVYTMAYELAPAKVAAVDTTTTVNQAEALAAESARAVLAERLSGSRAADSTAAPFESVSHAYTMSLRQYAPKLSGGAAHAGIAGSSLS